MLMKIYRSSINGGSNRIYFHLEGIMDLERRPKPRRGSYGGGRSYICNNYGSRSGNHSGPSNRGEDYPRSDFTINGGGGRGPS